MSDVWLARRLKKVTNRQQDHRDPFQRDRARIMHSASFRRLQSKTQVMGSGQSDFYRTRLTHSLETAQIGSGITAQLRCKHIELCNALFPTSDSLIETICLAHDIGHPPFGHGGEIALNYMMRDHGGFEGNGQTLRIVARLETFSEHFGMNLTRRTLLGLMKYPQLIETLSRESKASSVGNFRQLKADEWHPPKGLYTDDQDIIDWVLKPLSKTDRALFQSMNCQSMSVQSSSIKAETLQDKNKHHKTRFKSLDCSIMELADDIAYGIHDLEDAIVTKVVNREDFDREVINKLQQIDDTWLQQYSTTLTDKLFSDHHHLQKDAIGGLVNYLITAIKLTDLNEQDDINFAEPLLRYNATLSAATAEALKIFKDFVYFYVIKLTSLQRLEYRGQQIVMELFEALSSDPIRLLPSNSAKRWQHAVDNKKNPQRIIADYIAGMTDDYATRLYQSLFNAYGASDHPLI
ncbi:MAG: anti-phage deoxyguanosine triphosphatase [Colwellia sp.]